MARIYQRHSNSVGCFLSHSALCIFIDEVSQVDSALKTFENGRDRIVAVAQRKLLTRPDEPLWRTVNDFLTR